MNDEVLHDNEEKPFTSLSQVTPNKNTSNSLSLKQLSLVGLLGLGLVTFFFFPTFETKAEEVSEPMNEQKELTLSQNLDLIEQMKQQTKRKEKTLQTNFTPIEKPNKASPVHAKLSKELLARMNAPTTFFISSEAKPSQNIKETAQTTSSLMSGDNPDVQFLNQQNDITSVSATTLAHPYHTVPAGEMISATLETAIHSELPGMVRAITTRDIFSLEGQNCLIPRGSVLVGQFNSSVVEGQSRILVVWNRVQLANGVIISLNSPSTDRIGRAGIGADFIDRHFFERFSTSALLSVLGAYAANNGVNGQDEFNSRSQYRMAIASSFQQASNQALQERYNIKPTLQINQGTQINVFVAHDLDFYSIASRMGGKS
ncbi:TrbI/VirB10 family protein [Tatlockia micdadei]|uniref:TrbI/VirB10 family protein n=1 Tax=Legionella micdadei TaxID=451 RepID=UPI00156EF881|nr:TrbI/VirB10 family protein [Legionella micdadei]NSL19587.1 TrbI/VirB10 family protein [Legionella micdadei]